MAENRPEVLAHIARTLLAIQFHLASKEPAIALSDKWVLGYCFGMFDAFGQRAKLEPYRECFRLITIGFAALMPDTPKLGTEMAYHALHCQTVQRFADGRQTGGDDYSTWLVDTAKPPLSLCEYLR